MNSSGFLNHLARVTDGAWDSETGTEVISSPMYKHQEVRWLFVMAQGSIRSLIALFAMIFNGFLVYITSKHRQLQNTCGILLAAQAVADAVAVSNGFATFYYILRNQFKVEQIRCFWTISASGCQNPSLIHDLFFVVAFVASFVLMLAIAVDRLISVLLPIKYKKVNVKLYISSILLASISFGVAIFCTGLDYMTNRRSFLCTIDRMFFWEYGDLVNRVCLLFNVATVSCYIAIFFVLRYGKSTCTHGTRRILRALVTIVAVVVLCWMLVILDRLYHIAIFPFPTLTSYLIWSGMGILLALTQAIVNLTVLYFTSQVYRAIINTEFKRLSLKFVGGGNEATLSETQRKKLLQIPILVGSY